MNKSESIAQLADALSKAQAEMETAKKDAENPFFKSKYSDLASVWRACRAPLAKYGLSVVQIPETTPDGSSVVITMLLHSSGEWISGDLTMKPVKMDPQGIGSCITYARRYALAAIAGIAADDDDGNAASGKSGNVTEKPRVIAAPKGKEPVRGGPAQSSERPSTGADSKATPSLPPLAELVEQAESDFIDHGAQVNFASRFREALQKQYQPAAEKLRHDWLGRHSYTDADGNPSSKMILKKDFEAVKADACAWARKYVA